MVMLTCVCSDLKQAEQIFSAATSKLRVFQKGELADMKLAQSMNPCITATLQILIVVRPKTASVDVVRQLLGDPKFIKTLQSIDSSHINSNTCSQLEQFCQQYPTPDGLRKTLRIVFHWVHALTKLCVAKRYGLVNPQN